MNKRIVLQKNEQVNVSLDVVWQGAAGKIDARISEISVDGCFIESMGQEILGETIIFSVQLPGGIWVKLAGEIIRKEPETGFEVRFTNRTEENRQLLSQVIAAHEGRITEQIEWTEDDSRTADVGYKVSKRVLVADDDAMTLAVVKAIIETLGYQAVCASDGLEAFRILEKDADFDAAIFDMAMPHLDGIDLINYTKTSERLRSIPIGMITAEQDPKLWGDSMAAGASVFLPKPFTPPQVQVMLQLLDKKVGLN